MTPDDRGRAGAPDTATRERARERPSLQRRLRFWIPLFAVSYGMTLFMLTDTWAFLTVFGILGMATIGWVVAAAITGRGLPEVVPYATDGTNLDGPVAYHRTMVVKRLAAVLALFAAVVALIITVKSDYLIPLAPLGVTVLVAGGRACAGQLLTLWQCGRVIRVYGFTYRAPVKELHRTSTGKQLFRLGAGEQESPKLLGSQVGGDADWPRKARRGAWFAGDDLFGGVLLVPGSGELVWVSPNDPPALQGERTAAAPERRDMAKRAGIGGRLE